MLHRGEVKQAEYLVALGVLSEEGQYAVGPIVHGDPFEAVPAVVQLIQRRGTGIEVVKLPHELLHGLVGGVIQQQPVQRLAEVPLYELGKLCAHKGQLLSGMGHLIHEKQPRLAELIRIFPRHASYEGLFAVYHLVMGQGQYIVLGKGIAHGKGHFVVVVAPKVAVH